MTEKINPEYKILIMRAMQYHFPSAKIYLFGSRARGTNNPGADIDIAVDTGMRIAFEEMERARITLEHLSIPVFIDLVDMCTIPEEFKKTIKEEGVEWKN